MLSVDTLAERVGQGEVGQGEVGGTGGDGWDRGRWVGQGEMGGCTALGGSTWRLLQLSVEKPWSAPGGPFVCFLAQMGVENAPFTL